MSLKTTFRTISNEHQDHGTCIKKPKIVKELEAFDSVFAELVKLLVNSDLPSDIQDANLWFKEVLEYNVPHGKKNRGMFVATAFGFLMPNSCEEDLHIARILGWCVELLQAFFLVADDVMDSSYTRRGKPCWFRKPGVGLEAINDSFYLESCVYKVLQHYIKDKPYYVNILELFHEISHNTVTGQCLDMTVSPPAGRVDFTKYTLDKYTVLVKWKTAFYSFYLPVALAMYMAGICDVESHECAKTILLKIGHYFQVQDDYLDCYGDPEVIGKIGTDIQDNKCSWLVVTALQKVTPEQLQLLKDNYGSHDEEKILQVKSLYKDLKIQQAYLDFEDTSYADIIQLIETSCGKLPKDMFKAFVEKIYKRNK